MQDEASTADRPATTPSAVEALIARLRDQLRQAIAERLLWQAIAAVAMAGWVGLILDRCFEPAPKVRLVVELSLLATGFVWLSLRAAPRLLRPISDREVVGLLQTRHPREAGVIGTALGLRSGRAETPSSVARSLAEATARRAEAAATALEGVRLVRPPTAMPVVWFASVLAVAGVVLALVRTDLAVSYAERIALSPEPWPRQVRLVVEGLHYDRAQAVWTAVAPRGEPFEFDVVARVDREELAVDTAWSRRVSERRRGWETLTRIGGVTPADADTRRFRWRTDRLGEDLELLVTAGDARTRIRLWARERPRLTDLTIRHRPPAYLGRAEGVASAATIESLPEGSSVELRARSERALDSVEAWLEGGEGEERRVLEGRIVDDALGVAIATPPLGRPCRLVVAVTDQNGLASEALALPLDVTPDTPPAARLTHGGGSVITRDARAPLNLEATDDHGVDRAVLELVADGSTLRVPLAVPRSQEGRVDATLDLLSLRSSSGGAPFRVEPGQRLVITAAVTDHYDLQERSPTRSDPITLQVVTPAELLGRLGDEQSELRRTLLGVTEDVRRLAYTVDLQRRRGAEGLSDPETAPNEEAAARRWTAERLLDGRKAASSVSAAVERADGLRRQVLDNRLDQPALVERLALQVVAPLRSVVEDDLTAFREALERPSAARPAGLDASGRSLAAASEAAERAVAKLTRVAAALESEQTYNGMVTALRALIRDQRRVNQQTAREESEAVRDALFD